MTQDESEIVGMIKTAKKSGLKDWDVSFSISGEVFNNLFSFAGDINNEVPMKFYQDRIAIQMKSPDNIQFTEIIIPSSDLTDYNANIEGDPSRRDAKFITKSEDGNFKGILVDMKEIVGELSSIIQKDDVITIKIDTAYYKRIEFHCNDANNTVLWEQLIDPTSAIKSVENMPALIAKGRHDPNIKKAVVIVEPGTFEKICSLGGKSGKKRSIDERIVIEISKEDGLYITSGDKLRGRYMNIKYKAPSLTKEESAFSLADRGGQYQYQQDMEDIDNNIGEESGLEEVLEEVITTNHENEEQSAKADSLDNKQVNASDSSETISGTEEAYGEETEIPEADYAPSGYAPSRTENKKPEKKKKESVKTENREDTTPRVDQLLNMEVDIPQFVYFNRDYMLPLIKLKGLQPIIIEIRTGKPILIEQTPFNTIKVILTIAPRQELEDDM